MRRSRNKYAFTLLEVLLAVSLFTMVTLAVYTTFRTGMRALITADHHAGTLQSMRASMNILARDLRSVMYFQEQQYDSNFDRNEKRTRLIMENDLARIEQGLEPRLFDPNDPNSRDLFAELNRQGRPIDLSFRGIEGDDSDKLTFVRYYAGGYEPIPNPWNMVRVEYSVEKGNLFRSEKTFFQRKFNFYGEVMEPETEPPKELLARNVKVFDLKYGYWNDQGWLTAGSWNSERKIYRNPYRELEPLRGDPQLEIFFKAKEQFPNDGLPAFVDITLGIAGPGQNSKEVDYFQTRIHLPTSLETYRPLGEYEQLYLQELGLGMMIQ